MTLSVMYERWQNRREGETRAAKRLNVGRTSDFAIRLFHPSA